MMSGDFRSLMCTTSQSAWSANANGRRTGHSNGLPWRRGQRASPLAAFFFRSQQEVDAMSKGMDRKKETKKKPSKTKEEKRAAKKAKR